MFDATGHSVWAATDPQLYRYIPVDFEHAKHSMMYGAGWYMMYHTREMYEKVPAMC